MKKRVLSLILLTLIFFLCDYISKFLAISSAAVFYRNEGFALSFLKGQRLLLVLEVIVYLGVSVFFVVSTARGDFVGSVILAKSLYLGGALGNLFDRLRFGSVIDFLDWKSIFPWWPASWVRYFNLADIFIVLGLLFLIMEYFRLRFCPISTEET